MFTFSQELKTRLPRPLSRHATWPSQSPFLLSSSFLHFPSFTMRVLYVCSSILAVVGAAFVPPILTPPPAQCIPWTGAMGAYVTPPPHPELVRRATGNYYCTGVMANGEFPGKLLWWGMVLMVFSAMSFSEWAKGELRGCIFYGAMLLRNVCFFHQKSRVLVLMRAAISESVPQVGAVGILPQDAELLAGIFLEDVLRWTLMINSALAQKRFRTATLK